MEPITIFLIAFTIDGVVRLLADNSTAKAIKAALCDWINVPASQEKSFRFIYSDIQIWGSIEFCAKLIVKLQNDKIEVKNFDKISVFLPLDKISKIYSPEGKPLWQKVGDLDEKYFKNILQLGCKNLKLGRYKEAIQDWDEAIRLNDKYAEAYYNRGFAYYKLESYQRAIQDYDQAIRLNPKYAEAYNNRGNAYYQLTDYERAVKDYNKAVNIDPKYAQASENLVAAQKKLDELSGKSKKILTRLAIIPPLGFVLGSRHIFSVKAFDQNNHEMSIRQVAWQTTGGKIDRDGTFHAGQTLGRFTVTATVGSIKDEIYITVVEPKKLTTVVVTPSKVEIKPGDKKTFSVKGLDQHNREMFIGSVQWQTSGGSIDSNGTFKAGQSPGSFTVTATVETIMGQASVTVVKTKVDEPYKHVIGLKDRVSQGEFAVGDKVYFCTRCQLGYYQDSWEYLKCKCDQCKTLDKVEIYILPGTFISTVVELKKLTTLVITPAKVEIEPGEERTFSVKGLDQHKREMFIEPVKWQTSGGSIDSNGTFKAGQTPGSFTVTATVETIMGQACVTVMKTNIDEPYKQIIGLKDRVSQEEFTVGDKVYFCTRCQLGYHQDSWEYLNCKCDQCKTFDKIEIHILPDTVISKAINTPSALSSTKEIDLGALQGIDANGCSGASSFGRNTFNV